MLAIIGLLLAIIVNVDLVRIAHPLYMDEPVRQAVVAQATADTRCAAISSPAEKRQCVENLLASLDKSGMPCGIQSVARSPTCPIAGNGQTMTA
jgi:hypothetical protein